MREVPIPKGVRSSARSCQDLLALKLLARTAALVVEIPFTSASFSGSSDMIFKVSSPKCLTSLLARTGPIPETAPAAR